MGARGHADRTVLVVAGMAVAAVLFFAANMFSNAVFGALRLDLTQERLFTLSDGTRKILGSLDEPIVLRLYFSKNLGERSPPHATFNRRVRELLEQYVGLSNGQLRLELYNPEPFSDVEDRAVGFGLRGVPVDDTGDRGYFGLAASNSTDGRQVIPFFNLEREAFIEYDLTKLIYTLAHPTKKKVGLISSLPIDGAGGAQYGTGRAWAVMDQIREFFDVRSLDPDAGAVPDDIDILMVVHPKGLTDAARYAIDQFVLGGGRALVFVDPNAETEALNGQGMAPAGASEFDDLLKAWGVALVKDEVAGDVDAARRVNTSFNGQPVVSSYVAWLALGPANFDTGDVVMANVDTLNFATGGVLETVENATTEVTPLVQTGLQSMRIDAEKVRFQPDVVSLLNDFHPAGEALVLAARIKGPAKTAFPDGPPQGATAREADPSVEPEDSAADDEGVEQLSESVVPINVIVVADSDMLYDALWVNQSNFFGQRLLYPVANNADFVINALDDLSGSNALIGLRGKGRVERPFTMVDDIRRDAERRYRAKEQQLQAKLKTINGEITNLEKRDDASDTAILTADDKASLDKFRVDMVGIRKQLRDVRHALREDIERLEGWLKAINIAAIPLLAGMIMIVSFGRRMRRQARRPSPGPKEIAS